MDGGGEADSVPTAAAAPRGGAPGGAEARRRSARRRRRRPAAAALPLLLPAARAAGSSLDPSLGRASDANARRLDRDASLTLANGGVTKSLRTAAGVCDPGEHSLGFALYTDSHSIEDNSWEFYYAGGIGTADGGEWEAEPIAAGDVGGAYGNGAVVAHGLCVARVGLDHTESHSLVEACYDLRLYDRGGDGLTSPHSHSGGLAGGFSLEVDGGIAVEHRGRACLQEEWDEWNACALEGGFELCGVRVCAAASHSPWDGAGWDGEYGRGTGTTVASLGGSQCALVQPKCDPANDASSSSSSIKVEVKTDAFAGEFSYEVRPSRRDDSTALADATRNPLLLAGGRPVHEGGDHLKPVILGQPGVGAMLDDGDSHFSSACLPDSIMDTDACFDLRAHDAYGDGLGCGADGTLSVTLATISGLLTLAQKDQDMAQRQEIPSGDTKLACLDRERLGKWSYCAVRICSDGFVRGLEGNQCDFGHGDELIDGRYADVDPLEGVHMTQNSGGTEEEWVVVETEADAATVEWYMDEENLEVHYDGSWAQYYEDLPPGFVNAEPVPQSSVLANADGGSAFVSAEETNAEDKPDHKVSRPNQTGSKPKPWRGVKGPRKHAYEAKIALRAEKMEAKMAAKKAKMEAKLAAAEDEPPMPQDAPRPPQGRKENPSQGVQRVALPPFTVELLAVKFPAQLNVKGPAAISKKVEEHLLSHLDDKDVDFDIACSRTRKRIGREPRWVLDCAGDALFSGTPSSKQIVAINEAVREAFAGSAMEEFLEALYDYHGPQTRPQMDVGHVMTGHGMTVAEKKEQKRQERLERLEVKQRLRDRRRKGENGG